MHMDAYVTPTNDTDYSCHNYKSHRTYLTNLMGSISHHIMPLVINSLGGGHTHVNTHTYAYRHLQTEAILRTAMYGVIVPVADQWNNSACFLEKPQCCQT